MKVLVLGGTGLIGRAVVRELVRRGHDVSVLHRRPDQAEAIRVAGATPVDGDIRAPAHWLGAVEEIEAIVHLALTADTDRGDVDRVLIHALLARAGVYGHRPRFIYTGGCWLYGDTGGQVVDESTPLDPPESFAWMQPHLEKVLAADTVSGMVIHPALVFGDYDDVLAPLLRAARDSGHVSVVMDESIHWPLVHRDDLAVLYAEVLERSAPGEVWNAAGIECISTGEIAAAVAHELGLDAPFQVIDAASARDNLPEWTPEWLLDQGLSSRKARELLGWRPRQDTLFG